MRHIPTYIVFIVVVVAIGALIGVGNIPGAWYQSLAKPPFNPPNWIFGPVWTTLYVMIGIAGARTWLSNGLRHRSQLWLGQMVLNFLWSPVFFTLKSPVFALCIIVPMFALILAFIFANKRRDRISMWLFVPYAAWVAFATLLNASIVVLN
jgi:tryptophan-rich sensory protein